MFYFTFKPCFRNLLFRNIPQHDLDSTPRNCLCSSLYFFTLPYSNIEWFISQHSSIVPTLTCVVTRHVHTLLGKPHVVVPRILVKLRTNQTQTKKSTNPHTRITTTNNRSPGSGRWPLPEVGANDKTVIGKSSNDNILIVPPAYSTQLNDRTSRECDVESWSRCSADTNSQFQ